MRLHSGKGQSIKKIGVNKSANWPSRFYYFWQTSASRFSNHLVLKHGFLLYHFKQLNFRSVFLGGDVMERRAKIYHEQMLRLTNYK